MIRRLSPAKINLYLKVVGKRPDGYHHIVSLIQPIALYDELIFRKATNGIVLNCPDSPLPVNEDNLVFRAAQLILNRMGYEGGVEITLSKKIPLAAGLGGGSSNAATTLLALNELFSFGLTKEELLDMSKSLGADCPFFIFGKTAWATGIGETLKEAPRVFTPHLVLINPGFAVSTAEIYRRLNFGLTSQAIDYSIPRVCNREDLLSMLENDLEEVVARAHPEIREMKSLLNRAGALGSLMSGSGPTVFGLFPGKGEAEQAAKILRGLVPANWMVVYASSL